MLNTKFKIVLGIVSSAIVGLGAGYIFNKKESEAPSTESIEKGLSQALQEKKIQEESDLNDSLEEMSESDLVQELLFLTMTEQKEKAMIVAKFLKENFDGLSDPNRPQEKTKLNLKIIKGSKVEEDLPPEIA